MTPALAPSEPLLYCELMYELLTELMVRPKLICWPPLALTVGSIYSHDWSKPILEDCELRSDWLTARLFLMAMATASGRVSVAPTVSWGPLSCAESLPVHRDE